MYKINHKIKFILIFVVALVCSCKDLDEMNINPNGVDPADGHPNLLMATLMTELGQNVVNLGFGNIAGVMQHTQRDGWSSGHNDYDWAGQGQSWGSYYGILRTNDELLKLAEELNLDFHRGVGLVIRAYTFGLVTDLWGDAPYTASLKGEAGGETNLKPAYDDQKAIYLGILADLEEANSLLSRNPADYSDIIPAQDPYYRGDVEKWRKFANSLALRYFMRISNKEEALARAGIEKIASDPSGYPIIASAADDTNMDYIGGATFDSWPNNTVFDRTTTSGYNRTKVCSTLIEALQALSDPRIAVYADKIELALVIEPDWEDDRDEIIGNERHIAQNIADDYEQNWGEPINLDPEYIGLPPSSPAGGAYNLNPDLAQGTLNPHCSQLNSMYKEASGPMLKARMMSAAEVNFILAEAALKGWSVGADAQTYYEEAIEASLDTWGLNNEYGAYIAGPAAYNGTLEQLIEQKWIASWTAAAEAWFDYRRTGLPDLQTGPYATRQAIPLRFYYMLDEINLNPANAKAAIGRLETTDFTAPDPNNSAWSKSWLLKGTGLPY
ncbi:SusD/RagB family nutrient-binding outer membrane lipoprotein [Fulvivirgaceae bacterium BMA12]|uniref:SusD/RagB family nutrient-binding outer membrane lipoprotein n=1 Tax=Agaribacillus aureus TaxID=3051825 RepID=A0ABT8KZJ5_9BACT|nr:SusD/RagB family nutrient-binding outer membrane lipoprotein [Fulvivirgaceae bacterium BMA12]